METREVELPTGTLSLSVERALWPLDALCDFATRRNPKRAFLIVSKVLGRHIPAAPSLMRKSMRDLTAQVPDDLPGPVLVVGLAETAVCLGQGVYEELARRPGWNGLYIHSTRQQVHAPLLCRFEEPHSHASAHLIYRPESSDLDLVRSLVLVDDEISTGTTLANLAGALAEHLPSLERIVAASLTDWSGGRDWLGLMPRPATSASLLSGRMTWEPNGSVVDVEASTFDSAAPKLGILDQRRNFGRLGWRDEALPLPEPQIPAGAPVRVVGTGEFTYPAFLLAERLEQAGHDVVMHSTTRSPALPGRAIRHILKFHDNYAPEIANFLYNCDPASPRLSLICHETPGIDAQLVKALGATHLDFGAVT
ncbi:MAG: phosphoribosyltransferase domain-containing protein [Allosphingosinicella sp.]|uniref:phosphoribosyltransferase domain-containing protein n=1 Tax=Allosphingosinicella sp. TaxID=2823234 RepID=UPI00395538BB